MGSKALVKDEVHTLIRKNPRTGQIERTTYVGAIKNKPAGWMVDKRVAPSRAMACESGLA